jgi:YHS domain-containing protein
MEGEEREEKVAVAKTVCGGKLLTTEGFPSAEYRGRRVYFCTQACLKAFRRDPDRFIAGEIEHPV